MLVARRSSIDVARATLENAQTRLAAGTVTKVDVDRAELALVRAEQQEREAQSRAASRPIASLATLIQVEAPFHASIPPAGGSPGRRPVAEHGAAPAARVPGLRGAVRLRGRVSVARRLEVGAVAVGVRQRAQVQLRQLHPRSDYSWAVGLQLDWVIFDGGTRDARSATWRRRRPSEARARTEVLRDSIRDDLANGPRIARDQAEGGRDGGQRSVELARETLDLVRTQYEAGSVTQVDLLQAQDSLVAAQESLAQAHYDVAVADLTLRRAVGTFPGK